MSDNTIIANPTPLAIGAHLHIWNKSYRLYHTLSINKGRLGDCIPEVDLFWQTAPLQSPCSTSVFPRRWGGLCTEWGRQRLRSDTLGKGNATRCRFQPAIKCESGWWRIPRSLKKSPEICRFYAWGRCTVSPDNTSGTSDRIFGMKDALSLPTNLIST